MLGQQIAVPILLPMAVTVLVNDPYAAGDYYPGDLLNAVIRLPASAWDGESHDRARLVQVLRATPIPDDIHTDLHHTIAAFVDNSPNAREPST